MFGQADRYRLAVVAQHPGDLADKLRLAVDQGLLHCKTPDFLERKGIYLGERPASRPRVAFMFSGQGAQYPQMLKSLVAEFAPAAESVRQLDATLTRLGYPDFADLAWDHYEALGHDIWRTQLSILVASTILDESLKALGIRPDVIGCLSYGEFPALVCAGAWTFASATKATDARCAIVERCCHIPCSMLAVPRGQEEMERHIREVSDQLFVANITAEDQTVIGGEAEAIDQLARFLRKKKIASRKLTVPHAYHTPLMQGVTVPFRKILATIPIKPPAIPLMSSVSNRYATQPNEIRDNLAAQMREPVDYWKIFQQLTEEGVGAFVEVGPDSVLTDLHRKLLASMGRTAPVVASDNKSRGGGLAQLLCVQACLECCGALDPATKAAVPSGGVPADQPASGTRPPVAEQAVVAHAVGTCEGSVVSASALGSQRETRKGTKEQPQSLSSVSNQSAEEAVPLLDMRGSPYELGLAQGRAQRRQIRQVLCRYADMAGQAWNPLPPVDTGDATMESYFGADGLEELQGIADGAEVSRASVIAHNLQLYSAHGAGCFHFAVNARVNQRHELLHCANDDVPLALLVRCPLGRAAQVRRPRGGIAHVTFAVAGQLAGAVGINAHGLAVTSTILLDRRLGVRPGGLLHGVIVKRILERAPDINAALKVVEEYPRANAWSICLSHHPSDEVCCLEYDGQSLRVERCDAVVAANHSMILERSGETPAHSRNRLARWEMLVADRWPHDIDPSTAQAVLRDQFDVARGRQPRKATMNSIRRTDNQQSIVFQPGSACAGSPAARRARVALRERPRRTSSTASTSPVCSGHPQPPKLIRAWQKHVPLPNLGRSSRRCPLHGKTVHNSSGRRSAPAM